MLESSRYIHLDPFRVRAVRDPAKYRWSSYRAFLDGKPQGEYVDVEPVLAYFGSSDGRNQYRKFVLEGIKEGHRAEYSEAAEARILGDRKFVEEVKTKLGEKERLKLTIKPQAFGEVKAPASLLKGNPMCVSRCVAIVERQLGQEMLRAEVRRLQNPYTYHV